VTVFIVSSLAFMFDFFRTAELWSLLIGEMLA
jgi:hypothetical protein